MSVEVFDDIDRDDGRIFTFIFTLPGGDPSVLGDRRDPTSTTFTLHDPDGIETTPALTHVGTGVFTVTVLFPKVYSWWGRIVGTGLVTAVHVFEAKVRTDVFDS